MARVFLCVFLLLAGIRPAIAHEGVTGFSFKRGLFLSANVGAFLPLGGYQVAGYSSTDARAFQSVALTSVQPYVGLSLGYDVWDYLALGIKVGSGFASGNPRLQNQESPTDFSVNQGNFFLSFLIPAYDRFRLDLTFLGGAVWMYPPVLPGSSGVGYGAGLSFGLRYDTLLPGISLGLDVNGYWAFIDQIQTFNLPGMISMAVLPKVEYVF